MLKYRKTFRALRDKKNILTLVLSEKNILNKTKNHDLFKLNGRSLNYIVLRGIKKKHQEY